MQDYAQTGVISKCLQQSKSPQSCAISRACKKTQLVLDKRAGIHPCTLAAIPYDYPLAE
jgi:hypothetical protein